MTDPSRSPENVLAAVGLAGRLRAAEQEVNRLRRELQRVESSAAYQLGSMLAEGVRHPGSAPRNLLGLYRRWRRAGSRTSVPTASQAAGLPDGAKLLADLVPLTVPRRELPVLAGVLNPATRSALEPSVEVVSISPTSGRSLLERVCPDVLVVDSSAGLSGPWAQVGTYGAPERARDLLEILQAARELSVPTVAWRSLPRSTTPLFVDAESAFDVVLDVESRDPARRWDPGVQLRNSNPIAGGGGPRTSPLEALARGEPVTAEVPELLRDLPVDRVRDAAEQRALLRVIFAHYATPVMLARLFAAVGLGYEPPGRTVSLYISASPQDKTALVDSVLAQIHRPGEVVVTGATVAADWTVDALRASGVPARVRSGGMRVSQPERVTDAAGSWVAIRTRPLADEYELADLVLATECADADAVGYADEDFVFVRSVPLEACLIRREAAEQAGTVGDVAHLRVESGLRLLGISRVGRGR